MSAPVLSWSALFVFCVEYISSRQYIASRPCAAFDMLGRAGVDAKLPIAEPDCFENTGIHRYRPCYLAWLAYDF